MKKRLILALGLLLFNPLSVSADPLDYIYGLIFPEFDYRFVQFLPIGHLHKNKPRYKKYPWQVHESAHFDPYSYSTDTNTVQYYLNELESIYSEYNAYFRTNPFSEKIRAIVHDSTRDFEENNLLGDFVPPGLGGFTEMIKRKRLVVAFRDSPIGFRKLLRHEMVHRYQSEFRPISLINYLSYDIPLWFSEGWAQYLAMPLETFGDTLIRDAYLNGRLASLKNPNWPNSLVYTQGHFTVKYLAEHYSGSGELMSSVFRQSQTVGFEKAVANVTGKTLEEWDREIQLALEKRYYQIRGHRDLADEGRKIDSGGAILAAAGEFFISRKNIYGREVLFLNWDSGSRLVSKKITDSIRLSTLFLRGFDHETESTFGFPEQGAGLRLSSNTLTESNGEVVYSADIGGRDELRLQTFSLDRNQQKIKFGKKRSYHPEGVREIRYPIFIDPETIAFIGRKDVFAEVFVYNLTNSNLRQLSNFQRNANGLSYSSSAALLVTSVENEATQSYDLVVGDFTGQWRFLTETKANEFSAEFSPDGRELLYISDLDSAYTIYRCILASENCSSPERISEAKVGLFRPKWFSHRGLLFNALRNGELITFAGRLPEKDLSSADVYSSVSTAAKNQGSLKKFLTYLPKVDRDIIFFHTVSSDETKALILTNRRLALNNLSKNDPEIEFHLIDHKVIRHFVLPEFEKREEFDGAEILAGNNLLLKKSRQTVANQQKSVLEETYLYDWDKEVLIQLTIPSELGLFSGRPQVFRISKNRQYLIWVEKDGLKVYDALNKAVYLESPIKDLNDWQFIADLRILALSGTGNRRQPYRFWEIDLSTKSLQEITAPFPDYFFKNDRLTSWHVISSGTAVFFFVKDAKIDALKLWEWNRSRNSFQLKETFTVPIRNVAIEENQLVISLIDHFGQRQKRVFVTKFTNTSTPASGARASIDWKNWKQVPRQELMGRSLVVTRIRKLDLWPKLYAVQGVGGIAFGGRTASALVLNLIALDELNDKVVVVNTMLQNGRDGLITAGYENLTAGRLFWLDYWRFTEDRQRIEVAASQNIFLHPLLNWDLTLKEQYVRAARLQDTRSWLRTKLGTTFNVDTTLSDWHGPHSGLAMYNGMETGWDTNFRFRSLDLNLDWRWYYPLGNRSSWVMRLAAGHSFGPSPSIFIWGGNQTLRGIDLFSQAGNSYVLQSVELRIPLLDFVGFQISGEADKGLWFLTKYFDIRGGIYNDFGDMWYNGGNNSKNIFAGHQGFRSQYSTGFFFNVPTVFGLNLRWNKGVYGAKGWNFWLGYNW